MQSWWWWLLLYSAILRSRADSLHSRVTDYYSIRDRELRTATSTFTQLLSSDPIGECQARKPLNTLPTVERVEKEQKRKITKSITWLYLQNADSSPPTPPPPPPPSYVVAQNCSCFMNFVCVSSPKMMYDYEDCDSLFMPWWNNYWRN